MIINNKVLKYKKIHLLEKNVNLDEKIYINYSFFLELHILFFGKLFVIGDTFFF